MVAVAAQNNACLVEASKMVASAALQCVMGDQSVQQKKPIVVNGAMTESIPSADELREQDLFAVVKSTVPCKDYQAAKCHRGDKCKFAHIGAPPRRAVACRDWRQGRCTRGDACRYRHSGAKWAAQQQDSCRDDNDNEFMSAPDTYTTNSTAPQQVTTVRYVRAVQPAPQVHRIVRYCQAPIQSATLAPACVYTTCDSAPGLPAQSQICEPVTPVMACMAPGFDTYDTPMQQTNMMPQQNYEVPMQSPQCDIGYDTPMQPPQPLPCDAQPAQYDAVMPPLQPQQPLPCDAVPHPGQQVAPTVADLHQADCTVMELRRQAEEMEAHAAALRHQAEHAFSKEQTLPQEQQFSQEQQFCQEVFAQVPPPPPPAPVMSHPITAARDTSFRCGSSNSSGSWSDDTAPTTPRRCSASSSSDGERAPTPPNRTSPQQMDDIAQPRFITHDPYAC